MKGIDRRDRHFATALTLTLLIQYGMPSVPVTEVLVRDARVSEVINARLLARELSIQPRI